MGILPNFTAVDSNTYLPRLFTGEKFNCRARQRRLLVFRACRRARWQRTLFQYDSRLRHRGRRLPPLLLARVHRPGFWHLLHRSYFAHSYPRGPRYCTLGKNGFFKRASYAFSRSFITRNDRGTDEFNISEIGGNASEAALSNLYYPASERGFGKSAKNFATQMIITASANVFKEFRPDIRKNVFPMKEDESSPRH
jgi:hypothetical protein